MLVVSAEPEEEQEKEMKVEEEQVQAHRGGAKQKLHTSERPITVRPNWNVFRGPSSRDKPELSP